MRKTHLIREGAYAYCGAWAIIGQDVTDWHTFSCYPEHVRCGSCLRIYLARHCIPPTGHMTIAQQIAHEEPDKT